MYDKLCPISDNSRPPQGKRITGPTPPKTLASRGLFIAVFLVVGIARLCPGQAISPFSEFTVATFRGEKSGLTTRGLTSVNFISTALEQPHNFTDGNDDETSFFERLPGVNFLDMNWQYLKHTRQTANQFQRTPEGVLLE